MDPASGDSELPQPPQPSGSEPLRAGSLRSRRNLNRESPLRRLLPWLLGLAAVAGIGLTLSTRLIAPPDPELVLEAEGRVAILPIRNEGPRFDDWAIWGLSAVMSEGLEATEGVHVVVPEHLHRELLSRRLDPAVQKDRDRSKDLAAALGARVIVDVTLQRSSRDVTLSAVLTDPQGATLATFESEGDDLLTVGGQLVLALADALGRGLAPVTLTRALSSDPFVDRLYAEGLDRLLRSTPEIAQPYFEIALRNRPDFVQAQLKLIDCLRRRGELEQARALSEELLRQAQSRGIRSLQARAFRALGLLHALNGDTVAAAEQYKLAHRIDKQRGDPRARAESLYEQARLALAQGETLEAEGLFVKVLELRREAGDRLGEIDVLVRIGSLLLTAGQPDDAARIFADAAASADQLRDVWSENRVAASLGEVAWRQGEWAEATEHWGRALSFYQQQGDTQRILLLSRNLARALMQNGDYAAAEKRYYDQLQLAKDQKNLRLEAEATVQLAWLQLRQGYPFQARELVTRAVELDQHLTDRSDLQRVIAWMAYEESNYALAVSTLGDLRRQSPESWTDQDEKFLEAFVKARVQRRRLPLPGEADYPG